MVEKCNINLDTIFIKASKKLGDRTDEEGAVSPRILKNILDEGRFCEDELTAEYYGGILAASKSKYHNDDRGVTFLKQLESMSSYQIRLHYIIYNSIHKEFLNEGLNIGYPADCEKMRLYYPFDILSELMGLENDRDSWKVVTHAAVGLFKAHLISNYKYGEPDHLKSTYKFADSKGFIFTPTLSGAELLLWGSGVHGCSGHELFDIKNNLNVDSIHPKGFERIKNNKTNHSHSQ